MVAASGQPASAQCGGYGFGWGYSDIGNMYRVLADRVPYYAAFPPVYYSVPVARTYGHSPFAYLPTHETPEVEIMAPQTIINPYFQSSSDAAAEPAMETQNTTQDKLTSVGPQLIVNPYFQGESAAGPVLHAASLKR